MEGWRSMLLPLRVQITTAFLILFAVIALVLGTLAGRSSQQLVDETVRASFTGSAELALRELTRLEDTARGAATALAQDPIAAAGDTSTRRGELHALATLLRSVPGISAAYLGWPDGDFLLLRPIGPYAGSLDAPRGTRWLAQWVFTDGPRFDFLDAELETLEAREGVTYALDPRQRAWFRQAALADGPVVTAPYIFYTTREPGITAARRAASGAVAGVDVSLTDLSLRLPMDEPVTGTQAAVIGPAGALVAYGEPQRIRGLLGDPVLAEPGAGDERLPPVAELGVPVLDRLAERQQAGDSGFIERVSAGGRDWLGMIRPLGAEGTYFAMAAPLAAIASAPQAMRTRLLQLFGLAALLAAPLVWWAGRLLARPVERFTEEAERVAALEFREAPAVRTQVRELADLGHAMETARGALGRFTAVCRTVLERDTPEGLLEGMLEVLVARGDAARGAAWLRDEASRDFQRVAGCPPGTAEEVDDALAARIAEGEEVSVFTHAAAGGANGEASSVTVLGVALRNGLGEPVGVLALVRADASGTVSPGLEALARFIARHVSLVLERQRLVAERGAAGHETEMILRAVAEGLYVLDGEGRIRRQNPAARTLSGADWREVVGQPFTAWIASPDGSPAAALATLADGEPRSVHRAALRRRDGDTLPVAYECSALRDEFGAVRGVVVSFRDIAERLRAEYALRERVKELDCLYRVLEATVATERPLAEVCDAVVQALPPAMLNEEAAEARVSLDGDVYASPGWSRAVVTCAVTVWGDGGPLGEVAVGYRERRESLLAGNGPFLDEERAMLEAVAAHLGRFVSVQRTAARLRQSERLSAVGELTGGIAHDFNNLLTVILGTAEDLLESMPEAEGRREQLAMIRNAAERGAELTHHLIAFARRQSLAPRPTPVASILAGMRPLLERTLGDDIRIELAVGASPRPALVDPAQLENAVLNLCLNARDAMPEGGGLLIELEGVSLDAAHPDWGEDSVAGDYLRLSITDTGYGMDEDTMARAFEPFFTTKPAGSGSGLGLSMVYGFLRQSGGFVRLESAPGAGTTVRLYMPLAEPDADGSAADEVRSGGRQRGSEHVLLVEDDGLVREHTGRVLEGLGYRVTSVKDGREALARLRGDEAFDIVFSDVVMPGGVDGYELARAIGRLRPGLPVLLTSGYPDRVLAHDQSELEGLHFLRKPYRRAELASKLREVLG